LNCPQYTEMVKIYIQSNFGKVEKPEIVSPVHCCPVNQLMISACYSQKNVKSV